MRINRKTLMGILLTSGATLIIGCSADKPTDYAEARPDVSNISGDDSGLQSKDVVSASDQMARDLLTSQELNTSKTQWTMVVDHFEDQTTDRSFSTNYDIFLARCESELSEKSGGRLTLIEKKAEFNNIRNNELDAPPGANPPPAQQAIQPDYIMYGTAYDMPNRSTNYFLLEFKVFNSQTRVLVWSRKYEVKVAR